MIVYEKFKVAAHDECMKQFFVDDIEFSDRVAFPWVMHIESKAGLLLRLRWPGRHGQVEVVLDGVGNAGDEFHATSRTITRTVGSNVLVHWTHPHQVLGRIRRRRDLRLKNTGVKQEENNAQCAHETWDIIRPLRIMKRLIA